MKGRNVVINGKVSYHTSRTSNSSSGISLITVVITVVVIIILAMIQITSSNNTPEFVDYTKFINTMDAVKNELRDCKNRKF